MKKLILIAVLLLSSTLLFAKGRNDIFRGQLVEASCNDFCVVFVENSPSGKIIGLVVDRETFADVAELHSAVDSQVAVHINTTVLTNITDTEREMLQGFEQSISYYHFSGTLDELI